MNSMKNLREKFEKIFGIHAYFNNNIYTVYIYIYIAKIYYICIVYMYSIYMYSIYMYSIYISIYVRTPTGMV